MYSETSMTAGLSTGQVVGNLLANEMRVAVRKRAGRDLLPRGPLSNLPLPLPLGKRGQGASRDRQLPLGIWKERLWWCGSFSPSL